MEQAILLQPMVYHDSADINASPHGGAHTGAGEYGLKEAAVHGKLRQETTSHWYCSPLSCSCWSRLSATSPYNPLSSPTLEQSILERQYPVVLTHAKAVFEELQPMGGAHVGSACDGLHPHDGAGEKGEDEGVEAQRGGWGELIFRLLFVLITLIC